MEETMRKGNQGEEFEHYRVLLFSIAYRMTGSASDAEDLVQETYRAGAAAPTPAAVQFSIRQPTAPQRQDCSSRLAVMLANHLL